MFKIAFKKDWRCFKSGEILDCKANPLVLVGDQGAGKSSIFHLMRNITDNKEVASIEYFGPTNSRFFDTEKMNPRVQRDMGESSLDFTMRLYGIFNSHGQTMLPLMTAKDLIESPTPRAIIVDEPESGLSVQSQIKLLDFYREALKRGHSVTLATHSLILMKLSHQVFDVAQRCFVASDVYIKNLVGNIL